MRKILVAGAGHGGITAGIMLAKKGYDVTVLEACERKNMGWDWHDMMVLTAFDEAGIDRPDEKYILPAIPMSYYSPDKRGRIATPVTTNPDLIYIDRKGLSAHLIAEAEKSGVKLLFGVKVLNAIVENGRVTGVAAEKKGKRTRYEADLVIDAAGMDSPVRRSLPQICGVQNIIPDSQTFFVYRAYFERPAGLEDKDPYGIYLFHCRNKGMDWVIVDENFVDVLIGSFGHIDEDIINAALADFAEEFHLENKTPIRGGVVGKIPLRNTLPKFVWNGYAAAGDSAAMTEPMSGSGITLSMSAGRLLAERVIELGDADYSTENLWKYEYDYLKTYGMRYMGDENLKNTLKLLSADDINYFINTGVIGEAELKSGGIKISSVSEAFDKLAKFAPKTYVLPKLSNIVTKNASADKVKKLLPEEYDEEKFLEWQKKYDRI